MSLREYGKNELVDDSFQAFLVSNAKFTSNEEYPILEDSMISKTIPQKIMPFNKAITYKVDLSNTYICTYEPDKSFERIRRNPRKYISFFQRTAGLIGFDYSIHTDMPIIKQKAQINDNLSLTYFYGKEHISIIPNFRCGVDELLPEFFEAIPKHNLIAIGTHGFCKYKYEQYEWYCFLDEVINKVEPSGIIIYGKLTSSIFNEFKDKIDFYQYTPWIYDHGEEV